VVNFETFKLLYKKIVAKRFQLLIVDESSKLKDPNSQITQAILSLAGVQVRKTKFFPDKLIPYRYCLSGTPAPNDESNYWGQIKFVTGKGNDGFSDNYYAFRAKYFSSVQITPINKIFKFRSAMSDEFKQTMAPYCHVVRKEDALDLPEQTHSVWLVQLSGDEQKAYDQMEQEMVLEFGDDTILAKNALTKALSLRELTSGFIYDEYRQPKRTGFSKLKELKELLESLGKEQVIIWYNFEAEKNQILGALDNVLWADVPGDTRDFVLKEFKEGRLRYLLANPASLGHGLTLINCKYAVYFSITHSYELLKQSQDRIHRAGQKRSCSYYYLLAEGSYDEVIYKTLAKKKKLSDATLNYIRSQKDGRKGYTGEDSYLFESAAGNESIQSDRSERSRNAGHTGLCEGEVCRDRSQEAGGESNQNTGSPNKADPKSTGNSVCGKGNRRRKGGFVWQIKGV